jgi:hypothetical protein
MTWPDVIRSVEERIADLAAQERELQALYETETAHWPDTLLLCLHCAAGDPEPASRPLPRPPRS